MAIVHKGASIVPTKTELVTEWMPHQRWYHGKGHVPAAAPRRRLPLRGPRGRGGHRDAAARRRGRRPGRSSTRCPLTYRARPARGRRARAARHDGAQRARHALGLRRPARPGLRRPALAHDPRRRRLRRGAGLGGQQRPRHRAPRRGHADGSVSLVDAVLQRRAVQHLDHLPHDGSRRRPGRAGHRQGLPHPPGRREPRRRRPVRADRGRAPTEVPDGHRPPRPAPGPPRAGGRRCTGTSPSPRSSSPGSRTPGGWRSSPRRRARTSPSRARELGVATAQIHLSLAHALGTHEVDRRGARGRSSPRCARGMPPPWRSVPDARRPARPPSTASSRPCRDVHWPPLQRIHGDYHLGQVLARARARLGGPRLRGRAAAPARRARAARPHGCATSPGCCARSTTSAARSRSAESDRSTRPRWAAPAARPSSTGTPPSRRTRRRRGGPCSGRSSSTRRSTRSSTRPATGPAWRADPARRRRRRAHTHPQDAHPQGDHMRPSHDRTARTTPADHGLHPGPQRPAARPPRPPPRARRADHHRLPAVREVGRARLDRRRAASTSQHVRDGVWTGDRARRHDDHRLPAARRVGDGVEHEQDDPYRFAPTLGEIDLHLINEGRHEQLWTVLGAHVRHYDGPLGDVRGVSFAVWAPRAKAVHVIGDFNDWDRRSHPMRGLGAERRLGALPARRRGGDELPVRDPRPRRARRGSRATRWRSAPRSRRSRRPSSRDPATSGATTTGWTHRPHEQPAQRADERLRGPPRLVAPGPRLPRARRAPRQLRHATSASPTSSCSRSWSTRTSRRGATT